MRSWSWILSRTAREAGFGMIEIVVSMLLLSLLAIAFLPMLVTSLRVSVSNTTLASATQLVATQMDGMRSVGTNCANLATRANRVLDEFGSPGRKLQPAVDVINCPAAGGYPTTVPVHVSVTEVSAGRVLAEATTNIFVID